MPDDRHREEDQGDGQQDEGAKSFVAS